MKKILCAMSGGVDSTVAALLLKESGYDVTGVTLLLSGNEKDADDARSVCESIGVDHIVIDMRKEFIELIERPFCESYISGETPNPCIICNKRIKFGLLYEKALEFGFSQIATGHYARKDKLYGHSVIRCASDKKKDQSYMLWQLSEEQIEASVFPLGELTKPEIRKIATDHGFVSADRHDSQDICFVPDGDYVAFIERLTKKLSAPGDYIDINGNVLGKHCGHLNYTIGQRKGLGIALGKPAYVIAKDAESNTVTLGTDEQALFKSTVTVNSVNMNSVAKLPGKYHVKIRYAHKPSAAEITRIDKDRLQIVFDQEQRAPAKGQSAVFYLGDLLVGGGFIE